MLHLINVGIQVISIIPAIAATTNNFRFLSVVSPFTSYSVKLLKLAEQYAQTFHPDWTFFPQ